MVWLADGIDHDGKGSRIRRCACHGRRRRPFRGGRCEGRQRAARPFGFSAGLTASLRLKSFAPEAARARASCKPSRRAGRGSARRRSSSPPAKHPRRLRFEMPLELRNQVTRLEIAGERIGGRCQPARSALAVAACRPHLRRSAGAGSAAAGAALLHPAGGAAVRRNDRAERNRTLSPASKTIIEDRTPP